MKKKPEDLASEIRAWCAAHQDPKQAGKWARYFREGYDAWGLLDKDHPIWNDKQQEWLESYAGLGLRGFLKAGELLFQSGKYEEALWPFAFSRRGATNSMPSPSACWPSGSRREFGTGRTRMFSAER